MTLFRFGGQELFGRLIRYLPNGNALIESTDQHNRFSPGTPVEIPPDDIIATVATVAQPLPPAAASSPPSNPEPRPMADNSGLADIIRSVADIRPMLETAKSHLTTSVANVKDAAAKALDLAGQLDGQAADLRAALGLSPTNNPPAE